MNKVKIAALIILSVLVVATVATVGQLFTPNFEKKPIGNAPEPQKTRVIIYPPLAAQKTKEVVTPPQPQKTRVIIYPPICS